MQLPTSQAATKNSFQSGTPGTNRKVTGKAADSGTTTELRRTQQQANRQTVNNLFQGTQSRTNQQGDYSLAKGTAGVLQKGLQRVAEAGGNTLAFAEDIAMAPFELTSGLKLGKLSDNAPFNRWAQKIREEGDAVDQYYAENVKAGGKGAEIFDRLGSSLIAAAPQAAAAVFTGGTSAVASTAGLQAQAASALSPGLTTTIRNVVDKAAQNPQYWMSFSQTVGNSYENSIADMEMKNAVMQLNGGTAKDSNNVRTKAALQAIGSGLMNAAIEISGGLQKLPEELRHGESVWKALVDSGVDEGKENVYQGIVDRASQNLFYDKGNPLVSLTDPNAVFSLPAAANEFSEGFTVGSILSGGQAGMISAGQVIHNTPFASYSDILHHPVSGSYADALRKIMAEQNATAMDANTEHTNVSERARYRDLERKFLDGSIAPEEGDELWRVEGVWGQVDWANEYASRDLQAEGNMPAIANSVDDSYHESAQNLFRRYTSSIDSGELSPLADFALYQQINDEMDRLFNSVVTSNGIAITGKSSHSVARVIGSVEQRRSGVSVADVLHALTDENSEVLPIKELKNSRSQKFRSDKVEVSVNPDTGIIIQVNPVHSKRKVKQ